MIISPEALEWVNAADRDRDTVTVLLESDRQPYEIIAFHCQQCAEKYLKALLIQHDRKPPYVHDLVRLNHESQDICVDVSDVEDACERLTPFGTVTRYPGSIMEPSEEHMPLVTRWMNAIRVGKKCQDCRCDPQRIILEDTKHSTDEKRYFCIGMVEGLVATVRYTVREERIRIIGAGYWRAGKRLYYEEET